MQRSQKQQPRQGRRRSGKKKYPIQPIKINQVFPRFLPGINLVITKSYTISVSGMIFPFHRDIGLFSEALSMEPAYSMTGLFLLYKLKSTRVVITPNPAMYGCVTFAGYNAFMFGPIPTFSDPNLSLNQAGFTLLGLTNPSEFTIPVSKSLRGAGIPQIYGIGTTYPDTTLRVFGQATTDTSSPFTVTITYYIRLSSPGA
jgi:hypothetical protein